MAKKWLAVLALVVIVSLPVSVTYAQQAPSVTLSQHAELGNILVDSGGNTLYLFTRDEREASNCSGGCAESWPPLAAEGEPTGGDGVDAGRLGTITRGDGGTQVTYNGWPLYNFANDESPGDTNGQNRGGRWFVVSSFGGPIQTDATVSSAENATMGTIVMEASGRSLYLLTRDEPGVSSCTGRCALSWPPLLTVGAPAAGDGATSALVGTATRDDGSMQVTYNGWPLYYFARDVKPGDTGGQGRGGVWFVVSPSGNGKGIPSLPSVGDTTIPALAQIGLIASLATMSAGGLLLLRRRSRGLGPTVTR